MDAYLLRHGSRETTEPSLVSQKGEPRNKLKSIDLDSSEQAGGKCFHFSIREYVANTRRSNKKICWPFTFANKYNLEKKENLLPPINVAEFRWWNCENCLRNIDATASVENGVVKKNPSDEGTTKRISFDGNLLMVCHAKAPARVVSQVASTMTLPKALSAELNNELLTDTGRLHLPLCDCNREQYSVTDDPIKEGDNNCELEFPKKNLVRIASRSDHDLVTDEPSKEKTVSRLKRSRSFSKLSASGVADTMTMFCDGSSLEKLNIASTRTELICEVTDASTSNEVSISRNSNSPKFRKEDDEWHMKNNLKNIKRACHSAEEHSFSALNVHGQKNNACTTGSVQIPEDDSVEIDFQDNRATKKSDNAIENKDKSQCINGLGVSGGHLKRKKVQKMRMLSDIMKTEASGAARNISASVSEEAPPVEVNNTTKPDKVNMENHKPNVGTQGKQGTNSNFKKNCELPEVEDESSLIHWFKRKPKKVQACEVGLESKNYSSPDLDSKSKRDISKIPSLRDSDCATSEGNNLNIFKLQKRRRNEQQDYVQNHCTDEKDHCIIDGGCKLKFNNTLPELAAGLPAEGNLHSEPVIRSRSHEKSILSNQQRKMTQVEDQGRLDIHVVKDSVGMLKDKVGCDSRRCEKVFKKPTAQIANNQADVTAVDDIPVEILKLLQENWYKRHADEHSTESIGKPSEIDNGIINGKILNCTLSSTHEVPSEQYILQSVQVSPAKTDCLREPVLSAHHKNRQEHTFQYNKLGDDFHTAKRSARNVNHELSSGSFDKDSRCNSQIDMNEQGRFLVSTGFSEPSCSMEQPRSGLEISTFSNNGCCPQSYRLAIKNMSSHDKGRNSGQNSCRNDFVSQSTTLFRSSPFGIRDLQTPKVLPCIAAKNSMLSSDALMKRKRTAEDGGVLKAVNSASIQQQKRKHMVGPKCNRETHPTNKVCNSRVANECNTSIMRPLDLHTNETISAMNLLRLMDPAVCSRSPLCGSTDKAQINFHQQSDISYNYRHQAPFGLGAIDRENEETKHPQGLQNLCRNHLSGNYSNLYAPVPRIGVPVPYFLREDAPNFNNSRTPFSSGGRDQDEVYLFSSNCHGESNRSFPHDTVMPKFSSSRDQNRRVLPTLKHGTHTMPYHRAEQMVSVDQMNKTDEVHLLKRSCRTEICVVNRNPADFTVPGENNEYMTGYENLQLRGSSLPKERQLQMRLVHQRKQRSVNLISPKVLLRS